MNPEIISTFIEVQNQSGDLLGLLCYCGAPAILVAIVVSFWHNQTKGLEEFDVIPERDSDKNYHD